MIPRGPWSGGTFAPITWYSRKQSLVARSTADAEMHSLAEGMFAELLPAFLLLQRLLGDRAPKAVAREDNSAVAQAVMKEFFTPK